MRRLVFVLALASLLAVPALALPINSQVPSNAYIVYNNLDWAWGGACPYSGGCYATGDLTYQGTQGWSLPTTAELDALPTDFASYFVTGDGNVPYNGVDPVSGANFSSPVSPALSASCASPYFSGITWCDWSDAANFHLWAGSTYTIDSGLNFYGEQLYVRPEGAETPEPSSLLLLGTGLVSALGAFRRRLATRGFRV